MSEEDIEKLRVEIEKIVKDSEGTEWWSDSEGEDYQVTVIEPSTASYRVIEFLKEKGILK